LRTTCDRDRGFPMQQRFTAWILLASALVTAAMALSLPLAPVTVDQPVVTWPKQGERVSNTVVPLLPYRPLKLTAEVPCAAISAVNSRGGEVLRTLPPARDPAQQEHGLIMRVVNGIVQVRTSGKSTPTRDSSRHRPTRNSFC
jgi:hypothetical protein